MQKNLFKLNNNSKEVESIKRLLYSKNSKSQEIAIQQCKNYNIQKSDLILNFLLKDWNKKQIIEKVAFGYAEGQANYFGFITWFESSSFLGGKLRIKDYAEKYIVLEGPYMKKCIGQWNENSNIDKMYNKVRKNTQRFILSSWKDLFYPCEEVPF